MYRAELICRSEVQKTLATPTIPSESRRRTLKKLPGFEFGGKRGRGKTAHDTRYKTEMKLGRPTRITSPPWRGLSAQRERPPEAATASAALRVMQEMGSSIGDGVHEKMLN